MTGHRPWDDVRDAAHHRRVDRVDVATHDDYPAVLYATVPRRNLPALWVVLDGDDGSDPAGVIWVEESDVPPTSEPAVPGHLADLSSAEAVELAYALLAVVRERNRRALVAFAADARADARRHEEDDR